MNRRSLIDTVVTAAVVVVILPLVATVAAFCASFGIEATAAPGVGMFGPMGTTHALMLVWTVIAVVIVTALVSLLVGDKQQHA
jgi:heme/copper-type cytochrome/quinol oxidase subunit 2